MPFAIIPEKSNVNYRTTEYIDLAQGSNFIRILDDSAYNVHIHYVNGAYIECLGEECPVCKNNKRIIMENPKDFRNIPGYSSRAERYLVNVLDKTPAKLCPSCGRYNKKIGKVYPTTCSCGAILVSVEEEPINKVRILAKGKELFNQFNILESSVLDDKKEPIGLTNFDITLVVSGTGRDTKVTAVPLATSTDQVKVADDEKFDVSNVSLRLSEEELLELMKGVSVKDILLARNSLVKEPVTATSEEPINATVKSRLDELFS